MDEHQPFSLFGFGRSGLPGEVRLWLERPGVIDSLACAIIDRWSAWVTEHNIREAKIPDGELADLGTWAYILIEYHRSMDKVPPRIVTDALAHVLGLVGPKTRKARPSSRVLDHFGYPKVEQLPQWFDASQLDGEAEAAGEILSENKLAKLVGVSRQTISDWRATESYIGRRRFAAGSVALRPKDWRPVRFKRDGHALKRFTVASGAALHPTLLDLVEASGIAKRRVSKSKFANGPVPDRDRTEDSPKG